MKTIFWFLLFALAFAQAQSALNLSVEAEEANQPQSDNFSFVISFNADVRLEQGLIFEPADLTNGVLRAASINGQSLWLKRSAGAPDSDNVVTWQTVDRGLLVRFPQSVLAAGGTIEISYVCQRAGRREEPRVFSLFPANAEGEKTTADALESVTLTATE